jgi:hypothetical protein
MSTKPQWFQPGGFFGWAYSNVFIALFLGFGMTLLALHRFFPAHLFMAAASIWALLHWQVCEFLANKKKSWLKAREKAKRAPQDSAKRNKYLDARRVFVMWNGGVSAFIILFWIGLVYWVHFEREDFDSTLLYGVLYPADDQASGGDCPPPTGTNQVAVRVGVNTVTVSVFPVTIVALANKPMLVLSKREDGSLFVKMDIFDANQNLVARLNEEGFRISPHHFFYASHTRSNLIIQDDRGEEVLNVRYANNKNLVLRAKSYDAQGNLADLSSQLKINTNTIALSCFEFPPYWTRTPMFSLP